MFGDGSLLTIFWAASHILLWVAIFFLGFLLLGTLRSLGFLRRQLEQLEATTPSSLHRSGLRVGKKALDFTLPSVVDGKISLHDFSGRKVLLVFTKSGCGFCQHIVQFRLHQQRRHLPLTGIAHADRLDHDVLGPVHDEGQVLDVPKRGVPVGPENAIPACGSRLRASTMAKWKLAPF
jgi:hypothetical protein